MILIYRVHQDKGMAHDFKSCGNTILKLLIIGVMLYADSRYQGIAEVHADSVMPINLSAPACRTDRRWGRREKKKHKALSEAEKRFNHELSSKRVAVEHVNAKIKTFKIMTHPYRDRRRRHLSRTTLICGIINAETQI
jgi:hypothetical protein